jgi:hypothetical protein
MEATISGEVISMTNLLTTRGAVVFQAARVKGMEMAPGAICRVWYGKRSGLPQSFKDIGNFYAAANFAAFIVADRIEVVRKPLTSAVAVDGRAMATEERPAAP